jgi:hypothetical protein
MVLPQAEVDAFMATEKVVPGSQTSFMWSENNAWANYRCPLEVKAAQVGELSFVASLEVPEWWSFEITYRGEFAYRIDVRPVGNHPNPRNRPAGFPKKVPEVVHEHVYVEGLNDRCARPLADQSVGTHLEMFDRFRGIADVTCERLYVTPPHPRPRLGT